MAKNKNDLRYDYVDKFPVQQLEQHPYNNEYFPDQGTNGGVTFDELVGSVKQTGIRNPLIIMKASGSKYFVLSGNRRLVVAKKLEIDFVPVRIIKQAISDDLQRFIIIDENIQSRRFWGTKIDELFKARLDLYYQIIPDLKERLIAGNITAREIAERTYSSLKATQKEITKIKKNITKEINNSEKFKNNINNVALNSFKVALGKCRESYLTSNIPTRKEMSKVAKEFWLNIK